MDDLKSEEVRTLVQTAFAGRRVSASMDCEIKIDSLESGNFSPTDNDESALALVGSLMAATVEDPKHYRQSCALLINLFGFCAYPSEDTESGCTCECARDLFSQLSKSERRAVVAWLRFVMPTLNPPVDELASKAICYWLRQDHDKHFDPPDLRR